MSLGGRITNSCPVSENFEKIKLRRVGVLSDKPFDGYVAVRMERGAILPILCISLFTLLVTEHIRFLFPRVRKIIGKGPKLIVLVAVWSTGYYYTAVRSTNWLFMYINENWLDLVATQIYLTFTDIVCNACLFFSGCFEFSSFIESESNAKKAQLQSTYAKFIRLVFLGIKLGHLQFMFYDMGVGDSTFFNDHWRNFWMFMDDALAVYLFMRNDLWGNSREKMFLRGPRGIGRVLAINCLFWFGLFMSSRMMNVVYGPRLRVRVT